MKRCPHCNMPLEFSKNLLADRVCERIFVKGKPIRLRGKVTFDIMDALIDAYPNPLTSRQLSIKVYGQLTRSENVIRVNIKKIRERLIGKEIKINGRAHFGYWLEIEK